MDDTQSPEQGEDDLVQRLKDAVTDTFEHDAEGDGYYDTPLTFLVRDAATAISALRARVAELEARATPQAGASEAEPVAWMRDYPDMTCLTTTKPEPPEPGWRDIWMPLYAIPPDRDAVRAATHKHLKSGHLVRVIGKGRMQAEWWRVWIGPARDRFVTADMAEVVIYEHDGNLWARPVEEFNDGRFAALSNQGSSSNGQ